MSFKISKEVCSKCPLSTKEFLGVYTGVLRCTDCGCIIAIKEKLNLLCPKFDSVEEMLKYKITLDNSEKD